MSRLQILQEGQTGYGVLLERDAGSTVEEEQTSKFLKEHFEYAIDKPSKKLIESIDFSKDLSVQDKGLLNEVMNFLKESENLKNKTVTTKCILQKADVENRNGRVYPFDVLKKQDEAYQELIKDNRALGSIDHPDSVNISLKRDECSHIVLRSWWEDKTLCGMLEILVSPAFLLTGHVCTGADFIANLLMKKVKLGISSRGIGSVQDIKGKKYVQNDFELLCFDLVSSPSTSGAYLYATKSESLQENIQKKLKLEKTQNKLIKKIEKFINN